MENFFAHYLKLQNCALYHAPHGVIHPVTIPENCEYIEIITGGTVYHPESGQKAYRRGSVFWHQSGEKTVWRSDPADPYRCLVLRFVTDGTPRPVPRTGRWQDIPDLTAFTADMLDFLRRGKLADPLVFGYALGTLLRQMIGEAKPPRLLQKACRILSDDPVRNITVAELAKAVDLSSSRLYALFRKHLDSSPHRYQTERRIEMAKFLLGTRHDIPVKEVAAMCGFDHIEIFYRRFKQHTGSTPAEYRRSDRGETPA